LDGYPIAKGHSLVIPKRHVANYFDLTFEEQKDIVQTANFVQQILSKEYRANDFTVGINVGKNAGQKMAHSSLHIIPRYPNDCKNPSGGIRNILK
jgi:ATP adenylyltransferase